ncbi:MAG: GerAB/ArcD/ProY family transporter [Bacilli bacterium]|jgi:spore germination protein KB
MLKNKGTITSFQLGILSFFLGSALFPGFGTSIIINQADEDSWLIPLFSLVIAFIPLIIIIYIMEFEPNKNILEKNKIIFGNTFGNIINFLLIMGMLVLFGIIIWSGAYTTIFLYAGETPYLFLAGLSTIIFYYAVSKGLTIISRVGEILFYGGILLIIIVVFSLYPWVDTEKIFPICKNGPLAVISQSLILLCYAYPPLITLTMIPKNKIKDNTHYKKYLIIGFLASLILLSIVYFMITTVLTISLAQLYRYPEAYIQRKIVIGDFITGLENFLNIHWYFNFFILATLTLYFISEYSKSLFKLKKEKSLKLNISLICILGLLISYFIFKGRAIFALDFMQKKFHYLISAPLLIITLLIMLGIFRKKRLFQKQSKLLKQQ